MLRTLSFVATLSLALVSNALACQVDFIDESGNPTDPPTLDENIASSPRAFVGTVKGFRTYGGNILERSIECWFDDAISDEDCDALLGSVMSVVLSVDHAIKGITEGRLYEELYETGDGGCGPHFEYAKRYIYNQGLFGVQELPEEATEEQLAHWRSLVPPKPKPYKNPFPEYPYQCLSEDSDILPELAKAGTALVATVTGFRTDDTQLVDDVSVCEQPDSAACKGLTVALISVRIDVEASIKGDNELGPREVEFWERGECALPRSGQRYLLGGLWDGYWPNFDLRYLLDSDPPSKAQLAQWREAAAKGDPD
jgi:hypothetical protein